MLKQQQHINIILYYSCVYVDRSSLGFGIQFYSMVYLKENIAGIM